MIINIMIIINIIIIIINITTTTIFNVLMPRFPS
jgi:hypothetical protein